MSELKEYKLGELFEIPLRNGLNKPSRVRGSGVRMVNMKEIFGYDFIGNETPMELVPLVKNEEETCSLREGDLLFARQSLVASGAGKVAYYRGNLPTVFESHLIRCRFNKEITNSKFLYYLIKSPQGRGKIETIVEQTAAAGIRGSDLKELIFSIPDLPTQTAIAEILSSLDDKIELNNQINKDLEALAQTLFKHWFIDFDFPNENGEPYRFSGGEMVDSELGEIPKGWKVSTLDNISNITIGRTPPRQEHEWFSENPNDVKWISIRDMGNCGAYIHSTSEFLTEEAISKFNVPTINPNTVIISFKLTVGRISITTERMLSNEAIAHINLNNKDLYPEYLYLYLKQFDFDSLGSTSSIATAVNSKAIKALQFILPNSKTLETFHILISDIFKKIHNNTFESNKLMVLRDTLLPKLISGELAVSDIQTKTL